MLPTLHGSCTNIHIKHARVSNNEPFMLSLHTTQNTQLCTACSTVDSVWPQRGDHSQAPPTWCSNLKFTKKSLLEESWITGNCNMAQHERKKAYFQLWIMQSYLHGVHEQKRGAGNETRTLYHSGDSSWTSDLWLMILSTISSHSAITFITERIKTSAY